MRGRVLVGRSAWLALTVWCLVAGVARGQGELTAEAVVARTVAATLTRPSNAYAISESVPHPLTPAKLIALHQARWVAGPATAGGPAMDYSDTDYAGASSRMLLRGRQALVELGRQRIAVWASGVTDKASFLVRHFELTSAEQPLFHPLAMLCEEIGPADVVWSSLVRNVGEPPGTLAVLLKTKEGPVQLAWIEPETWLVRRLEVLDGDGSVRLRYEFTPLTDAALAAFPSLALSDPTAEEGAPGIGGMPGVPGEGPAGGAPPAAGPSYQPPRGHTVMPLSVYLAKGRLPYAMCNYLEYSLPSSARYSPGAVPVGSTLSLARYQSLFSPTVGVPAKVLEPPARGALALQLLPGGVFALPGGCVLSESVALRRDPLTTKDADWNYYYPWTITWASDLAVTVPQDPAACAELATRLAAVRRYRDALPVADRLIKLQPADPAAAAITAEVYLGAGRADDAWRVLQATLAAPDPGLQRVMGRVALARGDYEFAAKALKAAAATSPDVDTCRLLGRAQVYSGDYLGAINTYSVALQTANPLIKPRLTCDLGWACLYGGRPAEAVVQAKLSQSLDPGLAEAGYLEALALLYLGRGKPALEALERALTLDPEAAGYGVQMSASLEATVESQAAQVPSAVVLLGRVLEAAGKIGKARELYRRYVAQAPDAELKRFALERLEATKNWKEGR